jgi:acyl carrier protein
MDRRSLERVEDKSVLREDFHPIPVEGEGARELLALAAQLVRELHPRRPVRPEDFDLDSRLERDLGLDSLGRVELLTRIEDRFGFRLAEQAMTRAESLRDVLRAIDAAGPAGPARARSGRIEAEAAEAIPDADRPDHAGTLLEVLRWRVDRDGDRTHLTLLGEDDEETPLTHRELWRRAEAVAGELQHHGLEPGGTAAVMLPTCLDYFPVFFGILLAGGVPIPLYPPVRPSQLEDHLRRQAAILRNGRASILITVPEAKSLGLILRSHVDTLRAVATSGELVNGARTPTPPPVRGEDLAFLQYTSGSTGQPKGVMLTHANLLANLRAMGRAVEPGPGDRFVSWLPLYHDMGLIGAWLGTLYFGVRLAVMSPLAFLSRPERWLWAIHRHRATLSAGPNFAYELCIRKIPDARLEGLDLSAWRVAFNGSEPVSPDTLERFHGRFRKYGLRWEALTPVYGLAECTVGLTFPPPDRGPVVDRIQRDTFARSGRAEPAPEDDPRPLQIVSCGAPIPGHPIRIVDAAGRELGEREEGVLQFRGPSSTSGYHRDPDATRALIRGGWLDSGDRAYIADGEVYLTGRAKDLIIRAGRNLHPHDIEEAVGEVEGVRKGCVAVFGSLDPGADTERLIVVAETREADARAREELAARIRSAVAGRIGEPPDEVVLARPGTILKTSSGKLRRSSACELYRAGNLDSRRRAAWLQVARLALSGVRPQAARWLRDAGALLYAAWAYTVFYATTIPLWGAVTALRRPAAGYALTRAACRFLLRALGMRVRHEGTERVPARGPVVVVANHASYLDVMFLIAAIPRRMVFAAKEELERKRLWRAFLEGIGARFVERFDPGRGVEDVRRLVDDARHGQAIAVFPEGTFEWLPGLLPFRSGAFVTAAEAGAPVVPVTLQGTRRLMPQGFPWVRPGRVGIVVHPPLQPEGTGFAAAMKLRDAARDAIVRRLGEPDLAG